MASSRLVCFFIIIIIIIISSSFIKSCVLRFFFLFSVITFHASQFEVYEFVVC